MIVFAATSKTNKLYKSFGINNTFSGLFVAMIIFLVMACVCGCGVFFVNCDMSCLMNLTKLPFTLWMIFVIIFFFAVGGALFGA
jgi:hypothetical protein